MTKEFKRELGRNLTTMYVTGLLVVGCALVYRFLGREEYGWMWLAAFGQVGASLTALLNLWARPRAQRVYNITTQTANLNIKDSHAREPNTPI